MITGHPGGPHRGDIWRHSKTGAYYIVLGIFRLEATNEPAVRYQLADGSGPEWGRPVSNFLEPGRFELVSQGYLE